MAQNITLLGASYSDVPAVTLPKTGGGTASFTDVTDTTATASDVAQGKYFYTNAGVKTEGTATGGGGVGGDIYQDENGYLVLSPDSGGGSSIDLSDVKQDFSLTNIGSLFTAFEDETWDSLEYTCVSGTNPIVINFGRPIKGLLIYPKSLATDSVAGEGAVMSFSIWDDPNENGIQSRKWGVLRIKSSANTNLLSRISSYTLQNGVLSMVPQYPTNAAYHPFRFNIPYIFVYWWEATT